MDPSWMPTTLDSGRCQRGEWMFFKTLRDFLSCDKTTDDSETSGSLRKFTGGWPWQYDAHTLLRLEEVVSHWEDALHFELSTLVWTSFDLIR